MATTTSPFLTTQDQKKKKQTTTTQQTTQAQPTQQAKIQPTTNFTTGQDVSNIDRNQNPEAYQRALLGSLGDLLPVGQPLTVGDVPLLEANLNYQQMEQALADRAAGIGRLRNAYSDIGTDPNSILARDLASQFATGQLGPYSDKEVAQREEAIKAKSRSATESAVQDMLSDFARRNIGGGTPALELAKLALMGRQSMAGQLGDFAEQVATQRLASQQAGLENLGQYAMYDETARTELLRAIADAYLETERGPIDLSGLLEIPSTRGRIVGTGGTLYKN